MEQNQKEKFERIVLLVDNAMADPDIDIDYCISGVETTSDSCDVSGDPYILVNYAEDKYVTRKIRLARKDMERTAEDIANQITFYIEEFKSEVDAGKMGA